MVAGYWNNQDGLPIQYGTQKAVPELGGEYMLYGPNRTFEMFVTAIPTQFGGAAAGMYVSTSGIPNGFSGSTNYAAAGIQSQTVLLPLQQTTPQTASSGSLILSQPQLWIDSVELEILQAFSAGSGTATTITAGLAYLTEAGASTAFAQVAPNAGVQLLGACTLTNLTAGKHWTILSDQTITGSASTGITAGSWMGNVPLVTSFLNGVSGTLVNAAWVSIVANGTFTGSATGLAKLRVNYNFYGTINQ